MNNGEEEEEEQKKWKKSVQILFYDFLEQLVIHWTESEDKYNAANQQQQETTCWNMEQNKSEDECKRGVGNENISRKVGGGTIHKQCSSNSLRKKGD